MKILIDRIVPNPKQPRIVDLGNLDELAASIKQHGLLNPIAVEQTGDYYTIIDGERRWRASSMAGFTEIEANVRPSLNGTANQDRLILTLVGNIQREDMNPIEKARAFWELRQQGLSTTEIAKEVGISQSMASHYINLLSLDEDIQGMIAHNELPFDPDMLTALRSIQNPEQRVQMARVGASQKMSGPAITRMIKRMGVGKSTHETRQHSNTTSTPRVDKKEALQLAGGHWNMIAQLGYKPAVKGLVEAAEQTCRDCQLYDIASPLNCKDCPAVALLKRITFNG